MLLQTKPDISATGASFFVLLVGDSMLDSNQFIRSRRKVYDMFLCKEMRLPLMALAALKLCHCAAFDGRRMCEDVLLSHEYVRYKT